MPPFIIALLWLLAVLCIGALVLWGWMQLPTPDPFKTAGKVIIVVIFGIWFIYQIFGIIAGVPPLGRYR